MRYDPPREAPCNLEAEQALLGAVFINNDALDAISVPIEPSHFFEPLHRDIFDAMIDLRKAGRTIHPVSVKSYVPSCMVGDMTIAQYLASLAANAVTVVNAPDYARAVMDSAARRAFVSLGEKMADAAYSLDLDIIDEVDALRNRFEDIVRALSGPDGARTLADAAKRSLAATAAAYRGQGLVGVDYGLPWLMNMIGPLLPGQEIIIGGMTKHGKSTAIEQIVAGAAMNGHPCWVNSGEMKDEELARRALARITDIKAWQQVRGKVSESDFERLENARKNAETWQDRVFIIDNSLTLRQIDRAIKDFTKRHKNGLAVVDHIGLVDKGADHAKAGDVEFASIVTKTLKRIAGDYELPVIAAAQLKKNTFEITDRSINKKTYLQAISRRPKASDLYGSCEKDADHIIVPFRAEAVLEQLEPSEASDLYPIWEEVMQTVRDRAEIVLSLSRHTRWPQRKEVGWNGARTMFTDLHAQQQGRLV